MMTRREAPKTGRAYSLMTVKAIDGDKRVIEGMATTPTPDRMGDIVQPLGLTFAREIPLLHQHNHDEPVGTVRLSKPTKDGVGFTAIMPRDLPPGALKDRVDLAWDEVKSGLVRAVSIGFIPQKWAWMDDGGIEFQEAEIIETSLVTIPANAEATIATVRSIMTGEKPAHAGPDRSAKHAGSAAPKRKSVVKKTIAQQITEYEATRAAKTARIGEILSADDGQTLDQAMQDEFDGLQREVEEIDGHLKRLNIAKAMGIDAATEVRGATQAEADASRNAPRGAVERTRVAATVARKLPPGIAMVRMLHALMRSRANGIPNRERAADIAREMWRDSSPEVEQILRIPADLLANRGLGDIMALRSAVAPATTTDTAFAAPLATYDNLASEFIEFLRPRTIIGQIQGFRRVPFKVKIPRQTAAAAVNWVGEAAPKPLTSQAFDTLTVEEYKMSGIIAMSEELLRFSSPSAEMLARDDLANAIVAFQDTQFIDPSKSLTASVSPASVTNGVSAIVPSGTTGSAFRADVRSLMAAILQANVPLGTGVWIMTQEQALAFSLMQTSLGTRQYPDITVMGGSLLGFPVVASENIPPSTGSPVEGYPIIFAIAGEILLADDGGITVDISTEASLQMETAPDSPATASTTFISLWQQGLVGVRANQFINWLKRRSTAVGYIQSARYAE